MDGLIELVATLQELINLNFGFVSLTEAPDLTTSISQIAWSRV